MKLDKAEIQSRVTYHPPTKRAEVLHMEVREIIAVALEDFSRQLPECRETSLVMTKLEEALFWANAAIARNHDTI